MDRLPWLREDSRMTQQPFSRPGAIDLSGLKRPAQPPPGARADRRPRRRPGAHVRGSRVGVRRGRRRAELPGAARGLDDRPVVLVFYSPRRHPRAPRWPPTWRPSRASTTAGSSPASSTSTPRRRSPRRCRSRRCRCCSCCSTAGRPRQPIPGLISLEELRTLFNQLGQQLTAQGITGRHQPRSAAAPARRRRRAEEPLVDPRYAAAQDALGEGDIDRAVAEYQKLVDANPADTEAAAGLAMAKVLQRTQGVDLQAARAAAAASPDDVDAQTLVADLDMLGGHVDDAFTRLVDLVRRTADADRNKAREHLLGPVRRRRQRRPAGARRRARTSPPRCSERPRVTGR